MNMHPLPARVLIVDDHPAVREGLAVRISHQADMMVCGEAGDVDEALALVGSCSPDLMIVDISLRSSNGIDLIKRVRIDQPTMKMLVWSMYDDALYASRAQRAGAMGYVNKGQATEKIVTAIRRVLANGLYFGESAENEVGSTTIADAGADAALFELLSTRELEVFRLIGRGLSTQEVALRLGVGRKTIETYRSRIKDKLNLASGVELLRMAIRSALIED